MVYTTIIQHGDVVTTEKATGKILSLMFNTKSNNIYVYTN